MLKWDTSRDGEKLFSLNVQFFIFVDLFRNLFLLSELLLFFKQCALCVPLTSKRIWSCRSVGLASAMLVNRNDGGAVNCAWLSPCFSCAPAAAVLCFKNKQTKMQTTTCIKKTQLYSSLVTLTAASFLYHLWWENVWNTCLSMKALKRHLTICGFQVWTSVFNAQLLTKAGKRPHSPLQCCWCPQDCHSVVAKSLQERICEGASC